MMNSAQGRRGRVLTAISLRLILAHNPSFLFLIIEKVIRMTYHSSMATFILLSAIPGSGKSTWAAAYAKAHPNTYIVSSDDLRIEITGHANDLSKDNLVWSTFLERILSHKEEKDATVIADATMINNHYRDYYYQQTKDFDKHVLVVWNLPFEQAEKQNESREKEKVVPIKVMRNMAKFFEPVSRQVREEYDEIIEISHLEKAEK